MLREKLRKGAAKIKKANRGKWKYLSTSEKVIKVILIFLKLALIVYFGLVVLAVIFAFWAAFGIMGGITDSVNDQVRRSYEFRHRNRYYY